MKPTRSITQLIPDVLIVVGLERAKELLHMVDHTIIYRTKKNRSFIRNVEREVIKIVNGDKRCNLIAKWDIERLVKLYKGTR